MESCHCNQSIIDTFIRLICKILFYSVPVLGIHCRSALFRSDVRNPPSLHCRSSCHHLLTQQMNAKSLASAGHCACIPRANNPTNLAFKFIVQDQRVLSCSEVEAVSSVVLLHGRVRMHNRNIHLQTLERNFWSFHHTEMVELI